MKRAAIYARFSSDKQHSRSIDDQVTVCRALCEREGFAIAKIYEDRAVSGTGTINRFGWQQLMRDAKAGAFDIVVAEALDRCFRNEADYHAARRHLDFLGIQIHTGQGVVGKLDGSLRAMMAAHFSSDLADKVRRGQRGAVQRGQHVGPPPYGYKLLPPSKLHAGNTLAIDDEKAKVVLEIFKAYLNDGYPRAIAIMLNERGEPGPRGGVWNASAICGSRKRQNGILRNALYVGRIVHNRQTFVKDPERETRISRPNTKTDWIEAAAPHLAIVDVETFEAAQRRLSERGTPQQRHRTRPKHLLSGLVKCGHCGSGYVVGGIDKSGRYLHCSRMKETGTCDNKRIVRLHILEDRVIEGIEKHLAAPDIVAEFIREYHRLHRENARGSGQRKRELQTHIAAIDRQCANLVEAIASSGAARALTAKLERLEHDRATALSELNSITEPAAVFHPNAADIYRQKVIDLKRLLKETGDEFRQEAFAALRELVDKIVIHTNGPHKPIDFEIFGQLAPMLAAGKNKAPDFESGAVVVAGTGFEPVTFRL